MNIYPAYRGYNEGQRKKWLLLLDMTNAIEFGFDKYRFAEPGKPLKVDDAFKDVKQIETEWDKERQRRAGHAHNAVPALTKMPLNAQLYLHSVAQKLRKEYPFKEEIAYG